MFMEADAAAAAAVVAAAYGIHMWLGFIHSLVIEMCIIF
jgi:hypothetical protein